MLFCLNFEFTIENGMKRINLRIRKKNRNYGNNFIKVNHQFQIEEFQLGAGKW